MSTKVKSNRTSVATSGSKSAAAATKVAAQQVGDEPPQYTRAERNRKFGIDCPDSLIWRHWGAGGEYLKKLILKNTAEMQQKIRYELPSMKATFFLEFPEVVTLSSGMHFEIDVRFRPTELRPMKDKMRIYVEGRGSFTVDFIALTPYAKLTVPTKHDFTFCPVNVVTTAERTIVNSGTIPLNIAWEVNEPFTISPPTASLSEGERLAITISYHPQLAQPVVARAICRQVGESTEFLAEMKISGIGKYPYICCGDPDVDFGDVLTGQHATRHIIVRNRSCVDAAFEIHRVDDNIVNPFKFAQTSGKIPREGEVKLGIKYSPESTCMSYCNDFEMRTPGGNTIQFRCTGNSVGPKVTLSTRMLDYGDVDIEEGSATMEKFIVMANKSSLPVDYEFVGMDYQGAFGITPSSGVIGAQKTLNVKVQFTPSHPINYLRRVHVMVTNSDSALFMDLLGTGFTTKARPTPFNHRHVRSFHLRMMYGIGLSTPDDIEKLVEGIKEDRLADDDEEAARDAFKRAWTESEHQTCVKRDPLVSVLPPITQGNQLPFSIDEGRVYFRMGGGTESRGVHVRNHTSAKAIATWVLPQDSCWSITPEAADVPAFGTAVFTVRLRDKPKLPFAHSVQCYVGYKSMRSFRLVTDETFAPPLCLSVSCQYIPMASDLITPAVDMPKKVAFPHVHSGDEVYQVISLHNKDDTPVIFEANIEGTLAKNSPRAKEKNQNKQTIIGADGESVMLDDEDDMPKDELDDVFICYPAYGQIPGHGRTLVLLRFKPLESTRYKAALRVTLNQGSLGQCIALLLGEGFNPNLKLENNNFLYLRPTAVFSSNFKKTVIENPSRIPISYEWEVPSRVQDVVAIDPPIGTLRGSERKEVTVIFTPQHARHYELNIPVVVRPATPSEHQLGITERRVTCHIRAEGALGIVALEPLEVHFGTIMVGTEDQREITLFNTSLCDIFYQLRYVVTASECDASEVQVGFSQAAGMLNARSHMNINITALLNIHAKATFIVYCLTGGSVDIVESMPEPTKEEIDRLPHCDVTVAGGHPTVQVSDVRCVYQSKGNLWKQLSVLDVNQTLSEPLQPHDVETDTFTFKDTAALVPKFDFDLGVDIQRSSPIKIFVRLENSGHCPVQFRFWFPQESEVPKEQWHQEPTTTEEEQALEEIIDRRLFDIAPRSATIPAGGHVVVTFTYQHPRVGDHTLPVLLKIDRGKRLCLRLRGKTLHDAHRFLYFQSMKHQFLPVAIGDLDPPLQYTEFRNLSHHQITYHIDQDAFQTVREENYDFPVFQCLNPTGVIPAMSSLLLSWYFRPLEAKEYSIVVAVNVSEGDTYKLHITGSGFHPKKITSEQVRDYHTKALYPLPVYPTLRHPAFPMNLSVDVLRLGTIPFYSLHRRIIVLTNNHHSDTFAYEWQCALQYGDQLLDVDPPRGKLKAGESVKLRVTLYAGSTSHLIDNAIHCHVINEDLRIRRLRARERIENEAGMSLDGAPPTPGITGTGTTSSGGALPTDGSSKQLQQSYGTNVTAPSVAHTRKKPAPKRIPVTTVPPKFQTTYRLKQAMQQLSEAAVAEEMDDDDEQLIYVDVLPTVLEVLVQAMITPLEEYKQHYGADAANQHYYPTLQVYGDYNETPSVGPPEPHEFDLVKDVMHEYLQQLVHHPAVLDAYVDIGDDEAPYYCHIVDVPPCERTHVDQLEQAAKAVEVEPEATQTEGAAEEEKPSDSADGEAADQTNEDGSGAAPNAAQLSVPASSMEQATSAEATPVEQAPANPPGGELQCMVEEVLEDTLFSLINSVLAPGTPDPKKKKGGSRATSFRETVEAGDGKNK